MTRVSIDHWFDVEKRGDGILLTPRDPSEAALLTAFKALPDALDEEAQRGAPPLREHHILINLSGQKTLPPQHLRPLMEIQQSLHPNQKKVLLYGGNALQLKATLRTAGLERAIAYFPKDLEALESVGLSDAPIETPEPSPGDDDLVQKTDVLEPFIAAIEEVLKKTLATEVTREEPFAKLLVGRSFLSVVGIRTPIEWDGFSGEYTISIPKRTLHKLAALREVPTDQLDDTKNLETLIGSLASSAFVTGRESLKKMGIRLTKAPVLSILPTAKYALYDERVIPRVIRPLSTQYGELFIEIYNRAASGAIFQD